MPQLMVEIQANATVNERDTMVIVTTVTSEGNGVDVTITVSDGKRNYFTKTDFTDANKNLLLNLKF